MLPSSHTGGRRYFVENFQDGLAVCRVHGAPDLISTFTCNPKWPEITEVLLLEPGETPYDRANIVVRVYGLKLSEYIDDIRTGRIFGPVKAVQYTVEFQKRGLPHTHILIWQDVDKDRQVTDDLLTILNVLPPVSALGSASQAIEKLEVASVELLIPPTDKAAIEVPPTDEDADMNRSASPPPPKPLNDERRRSPTEKGAANALARKKRCRFPL